MLCIFYLTTYTFVGLLICSRSGRYIQSVIGVSWNIPPLLAGHIPFWSLRLVETCSRTFLHLWCPIVSAAVRGCTPDLLPLCHRKRLSFSHLRRILFLEQPLLLVGQPLHSPYRAVSGSPADLYKNITLFWECACLLDVPCYISIADILPVRLRMPTAD